MVRVPVKMIPGIFAGFLSIIGLYYFHVLDGGSVSTIISTCIVLGCPVASYVVWDQVEKRSHSREYKNRMRTIEETRKTLEGMKKE